MGIPPHRQTIDRANHLLDALEATHHDIETGIIEAPDGDVLRLIETIDEIRALIHRQLGEALRGEMQDAEYEAWRITRGEDS